MTGKHRQKIKYFMDCGFLPFDIGHYNKQIMPSHQTSKASRKWDI